MTAASFPDAAKKLRKQFGVLSFPRSPDRGKVRRVKATVRSLLFGAALTGAFVWFETVKADGEIPGLLFQGGITVPPIPVVVDPKLPKGPTLGWSERPQSRERLCSPRYPVCVHGETETKRAQVLVALQRAFVQWAYVLDKPAPLGDLAHGGGPELDVYLETQTAPLLVERDAPRLSSDQSSGFCMVDTLGVTDDTATAYWLALCVAELAGLSLDSASSDGVRRGWSAQQIEHLHGMPLEILGAVDQAQANPQAPILARERSPLSDASLLFWTYIDTSLGASSHGELPLALFTLARRQEVSLESWPRWDNTLDELDVLRRAFNGDASRMAAELSNFAVWRAFLGSRSDAAHRPLLPALGELGRVRFDWVFPYSSLPRHVAGAYPVHPLGSAYIWVTLDKVPEHAELGFRAEWEEPVQFQWALVRVDADGRAMGRQDLPYVERATSVEKTVLGLSGAAGLLIVGINLGAVDGAHPFDPDQEPWEPHSYTVYLTELEADQTQ